MSDSSEENLYTFKPVQFLGDPKVFPPFVSGKIQAVVQFIIPMLKLGKRSKDEVTRIGNTCGINIYKIGLYDTANKRSELPCAKSTGRLYASL